MARLLRAFLAILFIPALVYIFDIFQDYTDNYMTLNVYEKIFINALPYLLILFIIIGIFAAIRKLGNRGE